MKKSIIRMLMGHRNESGAVLILFALSSVALLGSVGLVHDFGLAYVENREMQAAADAAALGGAYTLKRNDTANVANVAEEALVINGYVVGDLEVNHPPEFGEFAGDSQFVEVILTKELQTYLGNFFEIGDLPNHDKVTIQTRAVAGLSKSGSGCIYVLAGRGEKTFHVSSGSTVDSPECEVLVSSCDRKGLYVDRGSTLDAKAVGVCGGFEDGGGAIIVDGEEDANPVTGEGCGDPRCDTGRDPLLEEYDPPSNANDSCYKRDFKVSSRGSLGNRYTISPGVYCGGLSVESRSHVEFEPGIYIIRGEGLNIESGSSAIGEGVSFYLTEGSGYDYEELNIASGALIELSAPTTGEMKGMLFYQDRDIYGDYDNKIESDSQIKMIGILYFPTQHLMLHSNTTAANPADWSLIVANTLEISSDSHLEMGADSEGNRLGIKKVRLVEGRLY